MGSFTLVFRFAFWPLPKQAFEVLGVLLNIRDKQNAIGIVQTRCGLLASAGTKVVCGSSYLIWLFLLHLSQCADEGVVLVGKSDGDAQAVLAIAQVGTIENSDTVSAEIAVYFVAVGELCHKEIGIAGVDRFTAREEAHRLYHLSPFLEQLVGPFVHIKPPSEDFQSLALCPAADGKGLLDALQIADDLWYRTNNGDPKVGRSKGIREGAQYNQIVVGRYGTYQGGAVGKLLVTLIDHDNAVEMFAEQFDFVAIKQVAGRVVGTAEEDEFRLFVAFCQNLLCRELKIAVQQMSSVAHAIEQGKLAVAPRGGFDGHDIVLAGIAEGTEEQVHRFVSAIRKADAVGPEALHLSDGLLQFLRFSLWIAVEGRIKRILVGIQVYAHRIPVFFGELLPQLFQYEDIGADDRLEISHTLRLFSEDGLLIFLDKGISGRVAQFLRLLQVGEGFLLLAQLSVGDAHDLIAVGVARQLL